jgi:hypothetical protein
VIDYGAIQPEAAGHFGLTAKNFDEAFCAIHVTNRLPGN